ncbi:nitroreductase family protein [Rhizorhabdus dicambivorans]|uniref:Nitroreductase n=1 Tax=Rhizorhabdus dicambivorans TaxID=1850238 RepID=A0A2A4FPJ0_9SPHN|nr:nitroreductase family protein [Rhizorhabdus dicambivorans]ATE67462.1 nitroreductase [Rhizorhabdus dicambivorans]PCE39622.1 nitroreductase [Rhizorhabdus dicambivorans]
MVRISETAMDPVFLTRWSPRAFDGSSLTEADMQILADAAHWAPSAFNHQPWRMIYSLRGDDHWGLFLSLLIPFNRSWAEQAGALIFFVSDQYIGEKPSRSHSFDTGAAWAMMALQASMMGLHAHGMTGLDFDRLPEALKVPTNFRIEAAAAIGKLGDRSRLPSDLRDREVMSDRKPLAEVLFAGQFGG